MGVRVMFTPLRVEGGWPKEDEVSWARERSGERGHVASRVNTPRCFVTRRCRRRGSPSEFRRSTPTTSLTSHHLKSSKHNKYLHSARHLRSL
jgi:hypothetical protein